MGRVVRALTGGLIGVVVVGLLVGAVARLRFAAQNSMCKNNCRCLSIALENYYDTYGKYPAATLSNKVLPPDRRLSWLYELDPFIHARMDPDWLCYKEEPWDSANNLRLCRERMPWYICPGSEAVAREDSLIVTNYVGAAGLGLDAAALPLDDPRTGMFGYHRQLTKGEITDGAGTTIMVVETSLTGPWMAGGWPSVRGLDTADQPHLGSGRPLGGTHHGGMNAAFADGSCRFIRDTVSPASLEAMFTIAGRDDSGPMEHE